ncbi:hypothetical protein [Frankia sp. Cr2]|uniref:hypothetical protein n=1 Tax=Frankia sp. Cr2 TaxID=3073932 RepID=UPI002AD5858C|nr:hypothetical protein [Frankia sp. Cr2]
MRPKPTANRSAFEAKAAALRGVSVEAVSYRGLHPSDGEQEPWDYGDWHHAVMGVELTTDARPFTIIWTNTFFCYGVEVFADPIDRHLVSDEFGPKRAGPDDGAPRWADKLHTPVHDVAIWWERIDVGPGRLNGTGEIVAPPYSVEVPVALRLDFDAGPVWFVAATPHWPEMNDFLVLGDEIVVVFTQGLMRDIGFDDPAFVL